MSNALRWDSNMQYINSIPIQQFMYIVYRQSIVQYQTVCGVVVYRRIILVERKKIHSISNSVVLKRISKLVDRFTIYSLVWANRVYLTIHSSSSVWLVFIRFSYLFE